MFFLSKSREEAYGSKLHRMRIPMNSPSQVSMLSDAFSFILGPMMVPFVHSPVTPDHLATILAPPSGFHFVVSAPSLDALDAALVKRACEHLEHGAFSLLALTASACASARLQCP